MQIPSGPNGHICLVITTKETSNLVGVAAGIREGGVDAHLLLEAFVGQQLASVISIRISGIYDTVYHCTGVIHTDNSFLSYCSIVTTSIGIDNGTAVNVNEGLTKVRDCECSATGSHFHSILFGIINSGGTFGS